MIDYTLDNANSVLHIGARGRLRKDDFDALAEAVDSFIEQTGPRGLVLEMLRFPGWEYLGAVVRHFRVVRNHHRKVSKVAVVTDSPLGEAAEHITSHFIAANIKHFSAGQVEEAKAWIGFGITLSGAIEAQQGFAGDALGRAPWL